MTAKLEHSLVEFEGWLDRDPVDLVRFMNEGIGFEPLWQLLVASYYDEDPVFSERMRAAVERIATIASITERIQLSERLTAKADAVWGNTGEKDLWETVQKLTDILLHGGGPL